MTVEKLITDHIDTWTSALQTRSTAGRGSSGKIDLYGIKKLRELILELAVRGKLVPQDPNDEPASELLKRIAAEKAELVKQGKIKKQKPLPEISEEEKPFELPEGWEWVRLGEFTNIIRGITFPGNEKSKETAHGKIPCLRTANVQDSIEWHDLIFVSHDYVKRQDQYLINKDIVMSMANSRELVGKVALATISENVKVTFGGFLSVLRPLMVDEHFLMALLRCETNKSQLIESASQTTNIANISLAKLNPLVVGIAPSNEQIKIVCRLKELMSLCDQLEQHFLTSLDAHQQLVETLLATLTDSQNAAELADNWARISEHFDTLFTTEASIEALKQTILQLAVMGKLVPQDPNDEPASELLKRIAQEKEQLIKDGKIKKQKPLPPISDDEKPFELPEGWEWCRLNDLFGYITDGDHQAPPKADDGIPFLVISNLNKGHIMYENTKFVPSTYYDALDWTKKPTINDMLYTVTGSFGIPVIVVEEKEFCVQRHIAILKSCKNTPVSFLKNVLLSSYAYQHASNIATGIAQKTVPLSGLRLMLVPLPPENTMYRVMSFLKLIDEKNRRLRRELSLAKQTQLHLADALTDAAIN